MSKLGQRAKNYWTKPVLTSAVILVIIYLASVVLKYFVLRGSQEPTFLGDEMVYKVNAHLMFKGLGGLNMHYPPVYSAMLMPSFLFSNFFTVMKLINVAASSTVIFPIFWIARRWLDRNKCYLLCVLSLLLPSHWIYPQYISSENLLLPLIILSVYFVSKPLAGKKWQVYLLFAWYGLLAAIMFLTRYQAIGAMAAIGIYLILKLFWFERQRTKAMFHVVERLVLLAIYGVVAIAAILAFVFLYPGVLQSFKDEMLFFVTRTPEASTGGGAPFAQWAVWYIGYMLLGMAPFVLPLVLNIKEYIADAIKAKYNGLLVLSFLISGAIGFIVVRHSDKAYYNQNTSLYMLGRYITYLVIILLINGFIVMFRNIGKTPKPRNVLASLIISVFLLLFSFFSLYGSIGSPARKIPFVTDSIVTADIAHFTLQNPEMIYFAVAITVGIAMAILLAGKKAAMAITSLLLVYGLVTVFPVFNERIVPNSGIGFSQTFFEQIDNRDRDVTMVNGTGSSVVRIQSIVDFWKIDGGKILVADPLETGYAVLDEADYLLINTPLYEGDKGRLFLYTLPLDEGRLSEAGAAWLSEARGETEVPETAGAGVPAAT